MKVKDAIDALRNHDPDEDIAFDYYTIEDVFQMALENHDISLPTDYADGVLDRVIDLYDKDHQYGRDEIYDFVSDAVEDYCIDGELKEEEQEEE